MELAASLRGRRFVAVVFATGLALVAPEASARSDRAPPEHRRSEAAEALRRRVAEHRYFDVAQQALRFAGPPRSR